MEVLSDTEVVESWQAAGEYPLDHQMVQPLGQEFQTMTPGQTELNLVYI